MVLIEYDQISGQILNIGVAEANIDLTHFPSNYVLIDETQYPSLLANWQYGVYSNGIITFNLPAPPTEAELLANAQKAKIDQIRDLYNQTLEEGFKLTIGTTQYTFGWKSDDITHMIATQTAVSKGFLTFPFDYADVNGNPVPIPDQATLDSIEEEATRFMMAQHQKALNLVGQVQSATTPDDVNKIQWTPATY